MSKLDAYQFTLSGTYLSDMFFNHAHDAYRRLHERKTEAEEITDTEIRDALAEDADDFLACLPKQTPKEHEQCVGDLIEDFLKRV